MSDLTAFLAARLDEDEAAARNAGSETWDCTGTNCEIRVRPSGRKEVGDFGRSIAYCRHGNPVTEDLALAIHVALHDPARVLREVEADRKLLAALARARVFSDRMFASAQPEGVASGEVLGERMRAAAQVLTLEEVARIRAERFSDHPDYDQAWKP